MLNKNNWFITFILMLIVPPIPVMNLARDLKLFDEKAWYSKWQYWTFGTICLVFPVFILGLVFYIQMLTKVAKKLNVPGSEIYSTPYSYILCIVVPIIGWILLIVMYIYLIVWICVKLLKGEGEKYAK